MKFSKTFVFLTTLICSTLIVSAQIQAGRAINITIAGVPDAEKAQITNAYPVSDNGVINMPYIGQVRAAGLRNEQLAAILESRTSQKNWAYTFHQRINIMAGDPVRRRPD